MPLLPLWVYITSCIIAFHSRFHIIHYASSLLGGREDVVSLKSVGRSVRAENLALLTLPLGLVDGINPVLNLHNETTILLNKARLTINTLGGLDRLVTWNMLDYIDS